MAKKSKIINNNLKAVGKWTFRLAAVYGVYKYVFPHVFPDQIALIDNFFSKLKGSSASEPGDQDFTPPDNYAELPPDNTIDYTAPPDDELPPDPPDNTGGGGDQEKKDPPPDKKYKFNPDIEAKQYSQDGSPKATTSTGNGNGAGQDYRFISTPSGPGAPQPGSIPGGDAISGFLKGVLVDAFNQLMFTDDLTLRYTMSDVLKNERIDFGPEGDRECHQKFSPEMPVLKDTDQFIYY